MNPKDDPILKRFRAALNELYGDRLSRVVLFGSRARGDARRDSDYDVAIFLKDDVDRWKEIDKIVPIVVDIMGDTHAVFSAFPYSVASYQEPTLFMHEIRREGVDV